MHGIGPMSVFLGYPPEAATCPLSYSKIMETKEGQHLKMLVGAAEMDGSIEGMIVDRVALLCRASCRAWVNWALAKPSIQLEPELLEAVGIKTEESSRSNASYRPESERIRKNRFLGAAKTILHICPLARYKDIHSLIEASKLLDTIPCEKILRKWLNEDEIYLNDTPLKNKTKTEIEEKLAPMIPTDDGRARLADSLKR